MTDSVILYSKPSCGQCTSTARAFDKKGINYEYVDVTEDAAALERIKELGYLQAPVVYKDETTHWSGYRPDEIAKLEA